MRRILLLDLWSAANRGDAAILISLVELLRERLGPVEVTVHTPFTEAVTALTADLEARPPLLRGEGLGRLRRMGRSLIAHWVCSNPQREPIGLGLQARAALRDLCEADLVLTVGGGNYNDNYARELSSRLTHLRLAQLAGKPVAVAPHSFGPFRRAGSRRQARRVLSQVDLLCARESESVEVLRGLGVPDSRIMLAADAAWALSAASSERAREILTAERVTSQEPLITISVRTWRYYRSLSVAEGNERYLTTMARLADHLLNDVGGTLLFASTCTALAGYRGDDRAVARAVITRMQFGERAQLLEGEYSPAELKAVFAQANLHVGTRMHSLIFSLGSAIPSVAIACEAKTHGMMRELGLAVYTTDVETLDVTGLIALVDRAWSQREQLAASLPARTVRLEKRAREAVARIAALCPASSPAMEAACD